MLSLAAGLAVPATPAATAAPPEVGATLLLRGPARAFSTAFSADGRFVATGANDGMVRLLDGRTGKPVTSLAFGASVEALAFSPDSRLLAGAADNRVAVWDVAAGTKRWSIAGGMSGAERLLFETSLAFTPDGRTLVVAAQQDMSAGGTAGAVALLNARTGRVELTLIAGAEPVNGVAVSPDGRRIAGVTGEFESEHPEIYMWDRPSGAVAWTSRADEGPLLAAAFSPDGHTLAVSGRSSDGSSVHLLDADSGSLIRTLDHGDTALSVAYARDGDTLASGGLNGMLRLWNPESGALRARLSGASSPFSVLSVSFSPDGQRLAAASDEGTVRLITMTAAK